MKIQIPEWVEPLRKQFPVTEKMIYFDSAYETGGSYAVRKKSEQYFEDKADIYPGIIKAGGSGKGHTVEVIEETRELLAKLLHAGSPRNIAFAANTCQSVGVILQSFPFEQGDNLVVGDLEHVSVLMPCLGMKQQGVECRLAHSKDGHILTADQLLEQVNDHTRMVVVSYVQSASGYRIDMKHLTEECHKKGIYVVTDAIQALGFIDVDVQELGVDALAASGYKGLLSVEGCGILYCAPDLLSILRPKLIGPNPAWTVDRTTGVLSCKDEQDARKLEPGTLPFHSIYALQGGLEMIFEIGVDQIEAHISECFEYLSRSLMNMGYVIDTPLEKEHHCHSMLIRTDSQDQMVHFLETKGIFVSAGHGSHVRVSLAPFTNADDLEALLSAAREYRLLLTAADSGKER